MTAMITAAVVGIAGLGGSIHNAAQSQNAKERAAKGIDLAQDNAIQGQNDQYDQTRGDFQPYMDLGLNALERVNSVQDGDYSSFYTSPGYQWRMDEGARNAENSFSNKGGGGNAMRAMEEFRQGLAADEFGAWDARQMNQARLGFGATANVQNAGTNRANQNQNAYMRTGENQAGLTLYGANQQANYLNQGISDAVGGAKDIKKVWGTV